MKSPKTLMTLKTMATRPMDRRARRHSQGFTLLEMIITMVITSIIAGMVSIFIAKPLKGYLDSAQRAALTDVADLTLRRISRDVRLALPNSIRCGGTAGLCDTTTYNGIAYYFVEFIPTGGGGAYRDEHDGSAGGIPLNFTDTSTCAGAGADLCRFDVIGPMPTAPAIAANDFIVVLNFGEVSGISQAPFNAYANGNVCTNCNRAQVASIAGNTLTLTPGSSGGNIFARSDGSGRSDSDASNRFHIVKSDARSAMYACPANTPGPLLRFGDHGFQSTLASAITAATATTPVVLANRAVCNISYAAQASLQRTGMLTVELTVSHIAASDGVAESVTLLRQIHMDNSP